MLSKIKKRKYIDDEFSKGKSKEMKKNRQTHCDNFPKQNAKRPNIAIGCKNSVPERFNCHPFDGQFSTGQFLINIVFVDVS